MNDLKPVYDGLKALLTRYEPPFTATVELDGRYELWSKKPVVIAGRPRKEVFFASIVMRKTYVGFYYMPVYTDADLMAFFAPELLKLLKGKSCFYVKELTPQLTKQIETALELGLQRYRQNGWV